MWLKNVSKVAPFKEVLKGLLSFHGVASGSSSRTSSTTASSFEQGSSRFFTLSMFRNSSVHHAHLKGNSAVITAFKVPQWQLEKQPTGLWELAPGEAIPDYSAFKS